MNRKKIIFVIGGCRSGKSGYALDLAQRIPGERRIFMATCIPRDPEMQQRVKHHQADRDASWTTLEIPVHLSQAITGASPNADVIVVDCLTLWLNNLFDDNSASTIMSVHTRRLTDALAASHCPVILVSNEVGMGIVPGELPVREYRDVMGYVNQAVAACADTVVFTVAGIPIPIKGEA